MSTEKDIRLKQRADTASNWEKGTGILINKPVTLLENELGWETDTGRCKLGDGSTKWTDLPYTTSVYRGTGENSIEQELESIPEESLGITYFNFGDKNPNAAELDSSLKRVTKRGAQGNYSVAFGGISTALGDRSQAENEWCLAKGDDAHAEGDSTAALGYAAHSEGYRTTAYGMYSHAEGQETVAEGKLSVANGYQTKASGVGSIATQFCNTSSGDYSTTLGANNEATGYASIAGGTHSKATTNSSFALGNQTIASGANAVAFGAATKAEGDHSFAANYSNTATGTSSTAFGLLNKTSGQASFAVGGGNEASGLYSAAFGDNTIASGDRSFAIGHNSQAKAEKTIAGGYASIANVEGAIAVGQENQATAAYATALGCHTKAGRLGSLAVGTYNAFSRENAFEVGTGVNGSPYTTFAVEHQRATVNGELLTNSIKTKFDISFTDDTKENLITNSSAKIKLVRDSIYLSDYVYADCLFATNVLHANHIDTDYISLNGHAFGGIGGTEETITFDTNVTINGHAGQYGDKLLKINCPVEVAADEDAQYGQTLSGDIHVKGKIYIESPLGVGTPNEEGYVATLNDVDKAIAQEQNTFWITIPWGSVYASSKQLFEIYDFSGRLMAVPQYFELTNIGSSTTITNFITVDEEEDISQNSKQYIVKYDSSTQKLYAYTDASGHSSEWYRISFIPSDKALVGSVKQ